MGNGIAHVFAMNGYRVTLVDVSAPQLEKAIATITKNLDRMVAKGSITEEVKNSTLQNLSTNTALEACSQADLVVEARVDRFFSKGGSLYGLDKKSK